MNYISLKDHAYDIFDNSILILIAIYFDMPTKYKTIEDVKYGGIRIAPLEDKI